MARTRARSFARPASRVLVLAALLSACASRHSPLSARAEAAPGPDGGPTSAGAAAKSATGPAAGPASPSAPRLPSAAPHMVEWSGEAMGTIVGIKVWTSRDAAARAAIQQAVAEIRHLEALMTTWRDDSEVSRINAAAGLHPVAVSPDTYAVIKRSLDFSRASGGVFDISYYALKGLWHFDQDLTRKLPDPKEVKRRLPLIDWRRIRLDDRKRTVFLERKGMAINLGGIAKGYAVDRAADVLKRAGFKNTIVQAGGDLLLSGSKSGEPWHAGIRDPRAPRDTYFAVAPLEDHAFSTAGDYERYFILNGRRYHHIIDPRTGYPATAARSVTIYAPDAFTADGLDDPTLILGPKKGLAMVRKFPGCGAVIVDSRNHVWVSKNLKSIVRILRPPTDGL